MKTKSIHTKRLVARISFVVILSFISHFSFAQIDPTDSLPGDPGGLTAHTVQNINFGIFSAGNSGGTIMISPNGIRSVTGDVIALNMGRPYFQAIFDIDTPEGSIVSVFNGSDIALAGSNGGSMIMHIGASDPPSPFITTAVQPSRTHVSVGGTLTVGSPAANPPGLYSGTFYVTFNQE